MFLSYHHPTGFFTCSSEYIINMKITLGELRMIIRESLEYQPLHVEELYHGTSLGAAEKIKKSGFSMELLGSKSGAPLPGISTTLDRGIATQHGKWAAKNSKDKHKVLVINGEGLKIAPGKLYIDLWNELGSSEKSIQSIKDSRKWDGVALFDPETGDGIEEQEILLFQSPGVERIK